MITNNTGIPLQLMQLHRGGYTQSIAGVTPNPATLSGLPRAAVPPAGSGRDGSAQGAPGLRSTVASPDADVTSTLDLPTGADSPVHPALHLSSCGTSETHILLASASVPQWCHPTRTFCPFRMIESQVL